MHHPLRRVYPMWPFNIHMKSVGSIYPWIFDFPINECAVGIFAPASQIIPKCRHFNTQQAKTYILNATGAYTHAKFNIDEMTSYGLLGVCCLLRAVLSVLLNNKYVGLVHVTQSVTRGTWANMKSVFTQTHEVRTALFSFYPEAYLHEFRCDIEKAQARVVSVAKFVVEVLHQHNNREVSVSAISLTRPSTIIKTNCTRVQLHHLRLGWIEIRSGDVATDYFIQFSYQIPTMWKWM